ncbi:MAG TPA: hypothetical protein PLN17_04200, partial [Candidatus Cloacimonas sp.]|nr:hypothetical protein [Candidatus Cloacimonas sp.]
MKKTSITSLLIFAFAFLIFLGFILILTRVPIVLILIITIIIAALFVWILHIFLQKQFSLILQTTAQIVRGNHTIRIPELNTKEFSTLQEDLNRMLEKLDKTIHHLAVHREELRLVLSSIDDILWSQNL